METPSDEHKIKKLDVYSEISLTTAVQCTNIVINIMYTQCAVALLCLAQDFRPCMRLIYGFLCLVQCKAVLETTYGRPLNVGVE